MPKGNNALSLIQLVIIVIVIIVIGTFLLVLIFDGLDISGNTQIKFKKMLESYEKQLQSYIGNQYMMNGGSFPTETLNANHLLLEYGGSMQEGNIFQILPTLKGTSYQKKIKITNGQIDVSQLGNKYQNWAREVLGDKVITK